MINLSTSKTTTSLFLLCTFLFLVVLHQRASAQIEVTFDTEMNTNCAGSECDYDGPGILINEIMMSPFTGDGSLWGGGIDQRGEWIELYNPDFCEPVDISCYYLGNNANDPIAYPGGYVIPAGTVVPPAGFVLIRGINADPVPPELLVENGGNTIELVVDNIEGDGVCVGAGSRLWFPNAGGWFAFYDSNGEPQDAVSWANSSNTFEQPCVPAFDGCFPPASLTNYVGIPDDRKEYILSVSAATFQGQSLQRSPDGGAWADPGTPSYGTCNADCIDPGTSTCNGSATVNPTGGDGNYVYQWDDAQSQTTQTAVGLCAQEYCVLVVDGMGNSTTECVTITEPSFETEGSDNFCEGDTYTLPDGTDVTFGGVFDLQLLTAGGCDSLVTFNLEMLPSFSFELNPQICENSTYTLPDGEVVSESGTYVVTFEMDNGCDSTFTIDLDVEPVITVNQDASICGGEVYELPDGSFVSDPGEYEVQIPGSNCDTLYTIDLNVDPSYSFQIAADICAGESYTLPDGSVVEESGVYNIDLTTAAGCDSLIETVLNVQPLPEINLPVADAYCFQAGLVPVNATPAGGALTGVLADGNNLNLTSAPPGNYSVFYTYTDQFGCSADAEASFSILPPVTPAFDYTADCFNVAEFNNLTPDPNQSLSYTWAIDDTVFAQTFSASYAYDVAGEYAVTLTATNAAGCPYSTSQLVLLEEGLQLSDYWLPNVISPNGDALNQALRLMPLEDECLEYRIKIFNRWGKQVFEMTESSVPFAGANEDGVKLEDGTYYYVFESPQIDCGNGAFEGLCNGSITVVR